MKKTILVAILAIFAITAYAKDLKELVVTTTPQMHCQNCENKIKGNLRFEKGVTNIVTNIPDQRVTVTYDAAKTNPEKIEKAFEKIGYSVEVINPDEKACAGATETKGDASAAHTCTGSCGSHKK